MASGPKAKALSRIFSKGILLAIVFSTLSGCLTSATLKRADGTKSFQTDTNGVITVTGNDPNPWFYPAVPFAAVADMATPAGLVLFTLYGWGEIAITGHPPY